MPATEMVRLVQSKELSPVDLARDALARIDEVNPTLNCFCFSYPEEALEGPPQAHNGVLPPGAGAPRNAFWW